MLCKVIEFSAWALVQLLENIGKCFSLCRELYAVERKKEFVVLSINYNTTQTMQWWAHECTKYSRKSTKYFIILLSGFFAVAGVNVGGKYLELCVGLSCAINIVSFTCSSFDGTTFFLYVLFFFTLFIFHVVFSAVASGKLYEYYFNVNSFHFISFIILHEFSFI